VIDVQHGAPSQLPTVLGLLLALLPSACANTSGDDALDAVLRRGELRWGADIQGGEPYVFEDPERPGRFTGFEAEIAEALARELGVAARLVQNDWSTLMPSLERGTFDVAMNGIELTDARAERVLFTRPYCSFQEQLVARAGETRVSDLASLRGLRVGTLTNSLAWDMLADVGAERVPYEGVEEPFADLAHGRTDAVLLDDIIVERYGDKPDLHVVGSVGHGSYAIALRKSDKRLAAALDSALERMSTSGELPSILQRWQLSLDPAIVGSLAAKSRTQPTTAPSAPGATFRLSPHQLALFLQGALVTLLISTGAMALAMMLGLGLALARLPSASASRRCLRVAANVYVEVFRGTPVLLQLYVIYYGLAGLISLDAFPAAILGLGLNYAAYEAEIYRGGIQAVPRGEVEAGHALGMSEAMTLRRVVLPQALRFSLPGIANDFIALLKDSGLVSVITVVELTKRMTIASVENRGWLLPGAMCALLYMLMSYPLSLLARRLEQRLGAER
jgi:polar amino acid transport system substrate-binding protein